MDDLLAEMRALRADLKETAAASMRVQALIARSALQEQRLKALSLQLNEANTSLERVAHERSDHQQRLRDIEEALDNGGGLSSQVAVWSREMPRPEAEAVAAHLKREVPKLHQQETDLRDRVNELSALVSNEQLRWAELNDRLDALDQPLPGPVGTVRP